MTYQEQLSIIKEIPIREGDSKVITCPFCYIEKKLSISKIDGQLKWYCFRASCSGRGIYSGRRSLTAAKNYLAGKVKTQAKFRRPLPSITTSIYNHPPAVEYLTQVNSLAAVEQGYIKVRYCPSEDRVLFYFGAGAVGRSLRAFGPKWVTFGEIESGVSVGVGETAVLVEDVPSACSVSRVPGLVGVALLGTTLTNNIKKTLTRWSSVYLVLDKDASIKSVRCKVNTRSVKIRITDTDLKHLTEIRIKGLLNL
tara:strand:+ start:376 stop:1134 length:759 start_codon:yes stop_codon:yes gene_type:complete